MSLSIDSNATATAPEPIGGALNVPQTVATNNPNAAQSGAVKLDMTDALAADAAAKAGLHKVPDGVPAKFFDAKTGKVDHEGVLKAYQELEKRLGATPAVAPAVAPAPVPTKAGEAAAPNPAVDQAAQFDLAKFTTEFETNGKLGEDSYKALEKAGLPKARVDEYIQGQMAIRTIFAQELIDRVGGPAKYKEVCAAAKALMTPEQISKFDSDIKGPPAAVEAAVNGLMAWHAKEFGGAGRFITADVGGGLGDGGYAEVTDSHKDLQDRRYGVDAGFTAAVDKKIEIWARRNGKI